MQSNQTVTKRYTETVESIDKFRSENKELVEAYEKLLTDKAAAEDALKAHVRLTKAGIELPDIKVRFSFTQPFRKYVDVKKAQSLIPTSKRRVLEEISSIEIDADKFVEAIRDGLLPAEARSALVEEAMTPRVTLSKMKD